MRTNIYEVRIPAPPIGYVTRWIPAEAQNVVFGTTLLKERLSPDLNLSYFVPEAGPTATPLVGLDATSLFGCARIMTVSNWFVLLLPNNTN